MVNPSRHDIGALASFYIYRRKVRQGRASDGHREEERRGEGEVQRVQLADGQALGIYLLLLRRRPAYTFSSSSRDGRRRKEEAKSSLWGKRFSLRMDSSNVRKFAPCVFFFFSLSGPFFVSVSVSYGCWTQCVEGHHSKHRCVRETYCPFSLSLPKSEGAPPQPQPQPYVLPRDLFSSRVCVGGVFLSRAGSRKDGSNVPCVPSVVFVAHTCLGTSKKLLIAPACAASITGDLITKEKV